MLELLMGYITIDVPEDNGDGLEIGLTVKAGFHMIFKCLR